MTHWRWIIGLGLATAMLAGCEHSLFNDAQGRSPYDRYLLLRGEARQTTQLNPYGGEEPNLRERLKPLDAD